MNRIQMIQEQRARDAAKRKRVLLAREVVRVRFVIENGRDNTRGQNGEHVPDMVTCGTCERTWDDGRISSLTPAPSARCPFEYAHALEAAP